MSAYRDRSQGFGFVWPNGSQIRLAKRPGNNPLQGATTEHLTMPPMPEAEPKPALATQERLQKIRSNLDRLQQLHAKLHEVLDELSKRSRKKP